jgi:Holliday junction DNA helicase RuvA
VIVGVKGLLDAVGPDWVYLQLGGVTLQVFVPSSAISNLGPIGSQVQLYTDLRIRDEQPVLFGFPSAASLELFALLTGISGVGPRLALALLSTLGAPGLRQAIASGDMAAGSKRTGRGTGGKGEIGW